MTRVLIFLAFAAGAFALVMLGRFVLSQLDRVKQFRWKQEILESCAARKNRRVTRLEGREEGRPEKNRSPRPVSFVRAGHDQQSESLAAGNVAEPELGPLLESHPSTLPSISIRLTQAMLMEWFSTAESDPDREGEK
jgi:hypothetical protein